MYPADQGVALRSDLYAHIMNLEHFNRIKGVCYTYIIHSYHAFFMSCMTVALALVTVSTFDCFSYERSTVDILAATASAPVNQTY